MATTGAEVNRWSFYPGIEFWQTDGRILGGWGPGPNHKFYPWDTNLHKTLNIRWFEYDPAGETTFTASLAYKIDSNTTITVGTSTKVTHATDPLDIMTINYDTPFRYFGGGRPYAMFSF